MYSGGISWSDLNPFNYEACIGDYCTDLETIAETAKETVDAAPGAIVDGVKTVYDFYAEKPAMLPAIVFGWPFMLFGAGCTNKGSEPSAPRITLNFEESDNPQAYKLYQGLLREGVAQSDIDKGYNVINFDGKYCASQEEKSCIKGANDLKIDSQEVFEYAMNNYERFRNLIEATLGHPLPWVLDDLNPETTFDEDIQTKVTDAINLLKDIITRKGFVEGTEEYKKRLAFGLFWLTTTPPAGLSTLNPDFLLYANEELNKFEFGEFANFLVRRGGLRPKYNEVEYTALEAINRTEGDCSEVSKILFSVFETAGLNPIFLQVSLGVEDVALLDGPESLRTRSNTLLERATKSNPDFNHFCISLQLDNQRRLFDPIFYQSDAQYRKNFPLALRQALSIFYSNSACLLVQDNNLAAAEDAARTAILLDDMNANALLALSNISRQMNSLDDAIDFCTQAIDIYSSSNYFFVRGTIWLQKGNLSMAINDLAHCLQLKSENRNDVQHNLTVYIVKKWMGNPLVKTFGDETFFDISKIEFLFITSSIDWILGKRNTATEALHVVADGFTLNGRPSDFTKQFFESMFQLMPADMQQDAEISGMITSIRQKLGTAQ